jgi:hypothetical protein
MRIQGGPVLTGGALVVASNLRHPTVVATIAQGRLVHLTEASRLH